MIRAARTVSVLVGLVANLIPLYGVLYWQWDAFQLLMLYWTETAIIAGFTLLRLSKLSGPERGEITVNGKPQPATPFSLVGFFALHAGLFIFVHFVMLWAFFSWDWFKKVHGVGSFFYQLYGANFVWAALLFCRRRAVIVRPPAALSVSVSVPSAAPSAARAVSLPPTRSRSLPL